VAVLAVAPDVVARLFELLKRRRRRKRRARPAEHH